MAGWIVCALIVVAVSAVALIDLVPTVTNWLERIGIGSLGEGTKPAVRKTCEQWLQKTPAVPVSDQTRFTLPERIRGTYKSKNIQAWQQGALLLGAQENKDVEALAASLFLQNGDFSKPAERVDFALLAYAVLRTQKNPQAVRPAMDRIYTYLKNNIKDGTVPYNPAVPDVRFVDTLGMICPFLSLYGKVYDVPEATDLSKKQLSEYVSLGIHPELSLPVHAVRKTDGAPLGVYGWGRGCGWYALALAEMMRMGEDVQEYALPFADALLKAQLPNGGFARQLLAEGFGESSATAMLGHFMAVLYSVTNEESYKNAAEKAAAFLKTCVRKNGKVDFAQGDTKGIGFYSMRLSTMPAAQGFALLLLEEVG